MITIESMIKELSACPRFAKSHKETRRDIADGKVKLEVKPIAMFIGSGSGE